MTQSEFIKKLEEIISRFEEDGMYALKGLKDYVEDLKKIQVVKKNICKSMKERNIIK